MLINLTNHPSGAWAPEQRQAAHEAFGTIVDLPFPAIDPHLESRQVRDLAATYAAKALALIGDPYAHEETCAASDACQCPAHAIHLMGETSFIVAFARLWGDGGTRPDQIGLVCSTTERLVNEMPDGTKQSTFRFVRFRDM